MIEPSGKRSEGFQWSGFHRCLDRKNDADAGNAEGSSIQLHRYRFRRPDQWTVLKMTTLVFMKRLFDNY